MRLKPLTRGLQPGRNPPSERMHGQRKEERMLLLILIILVLLVLFGGWGYRRWY